MHCAALRLTVGHNVSSVCATSIKERSSSQATIGSGLCIGLGTDLFAGAGAGGERAAAIILISRTCATYLRA
jgi:hypothetical protein